MTDALVIPPEKITETRDVPMQWYGMTVEACIAEMIREMKPRLLAEAEKRRVSLPEGKPTYRLTLHLEQTGYRRPPITQMPSWAVDDERWQREVEHAGGKQPLAIAWEGREEAVAPEPTEGPHSRACGINEHPHGRRCAKDCPTCHP